MSAAAASAGIRVVCPTCQRQERWSGEVRDVVIEGGSRRPDGPSERAAFDTLLASSRGELGPVVGTCPCGQPMVAPGGTQRPAFTLTLATDPTGRGPRPGQVITLDGDVLSLDGQPHDPEALAKAVHAAYPLGLPHEESFAVRVLQGGIASMMIFPAIAWVCAVFVVIIFYATWATGTGASVGPP